MKIEMDKLEELVWVFLCFFFSKSNCRLALRNFFMIALMPLKIALVPRIFTKSKGKKTTKVTKPYYENIFLKFCPKTLTRFANLCVCNLRDF